MVRQRAQPKGRKSQWTATGGTWEVRLGQLQVLFVIERSKLAQRLGGKQPWSQPPLKAFHEL